MHYSSNSMYNVMLYIHSNFHFRNTKYKGLKLPKKKKKTVLSPHYTILWPMLNRQPSKNCYFYPYKHHICSRLISYPTPNDKPKRGKIRHICHNSVHLYFTFAPSSYIKLLHITKVLLQLLPMLSSKIREVLQYKISMPLNSLFYVYGISFLPKNLYT